MPEPTPERLQSPPGGQQHCMPSQVLRPIPLGQVKLLLPPPLELPPEDPPEEDFRQELPDL